MEYQKNVSESPIEPFFLSECDWQPARRSSVEELWAGFNEQAEEYDQVGGPEDSDGTEQ